MTDQPLPTTCPVLLKKKRMAEALDVSQTKFEDLDARGLIPRVVLGSRCIRYNPSEVIQQLERLRGRAYLREVIDG